MNTPDQMRGDLQAAVQMLAADNARLCDIGIAADRLHEAAERIATLYPDSPTVKRLLVPALDAYTIVRQGQ